MAAWSRTWATYPSRRTWRRSSARAVIPHRPRARWSPCTSTRRRWGRRREGARTGRRNRRSRVAPTTRSLLRQTRSPSQPRKSCARPSKNSPSRSQGVTVTASTRARIPSATASTANTVSCPSTRDRSHNRTVVAPSGPRTTSSICSAPFPIRLTRRRYSRRPFDGATSTVAKNHLFAAVTCERTARKDCCARHRATCCSPSSSRDGPVRL